jgi:hypothetical protein
MPRAPKKDRLAVGVYLDRAVHAEAKRVADAGGWNVTQVLRMAISKGLPMVAARLNDEGEDAA